MRRVAIDFDGTLSRPDVQEFVYKLLQKGVDVTVFTYRYDEAHFHKYEGAYKDNNDLWEVVGMLGLNKNVVFTNCQPKSEYINSAGNFTLILDDDYRVMRDIEKNCKNVIPIQVNRGKWRQKILKRLGYKFENE